MKRIVVLLALFVLLITAQGSPAADLQAGWYVKLGGVELYGIDPVQHHPAVVGWKFTGGLGVDGPFEVTSPASWPSWPERVVSVPNDAPNVPPGTDVWLWGEPTSVPTWPITEVSFYWETDYQASQMRLELYKYSSGTGYTFLWAQDQSEISTSWNNVLAYDQQIEVGLVPVFRVTTVPEPSALAFVPGACLLFVARRRATV